MTIDEGYLKYTSDWSRGPAPEQAVTDLLDEWRRRLYQAKLIGHYADLGVGYGNISVRSKGTGLFVISGTQTGHIAATCGEHYALVTAYDLAENRVSCVGPLQASSESLTHAAIYELDEAVGAVVHAHSRRLWEQHLDGLPTTDASVAYGTPEMAQEFGRLYRETDFATGGLAVMAGHREGIVSIGTTLEEAASRLIRMQSESE